METLTVIVKENKLEECLIDFGLAVAMTFLEHDA